MVNASLPRIEQSNKLLHAALIYAEKFGFQVLPLHSIRNGKCTCGSAKCAAGKHPILQHGVKDSTSNSEEIRALWKRYPFANIGIRTGKESGIFVLDVDTKGVDGRETLAEIEHEHGQLPDTVTVITGSQGLHYFFQYEEGVGNKVGLAPSLDIRGNNGFVVAAPSVHVSGKRYEYELSSHIMDMPIAKAPQWLINMLVKPFHTMGEQPTKQPTSHWQNLMKGLSEGEGRNQAAASIMGHLLRKRVDEFLAIEIMKLWNERNDPPMDDEELGKTLASIMRKEAERRGIL